MSLKTCTVLYFTSRTNSIVYPVVHCGIHLVLAPIPISKYENGISTTTVDGRGQLGTVPATAGRLFGHGVSPPIPPHPHLLLPVALRRYLEEVTPFDGGGLVWDVVREGGVVYGVCSVSPPIELVARMQACLLAGSHV